ncbi:hypothetical protein MRBLMI12_000420 [Microbacterium sp. LMI12-1-1.1]|uniref:hypothetical protein n=1 Tax=Microbacterium sp. LMI12-1-1.1 TaxID=3135225 RepID=UPI003436414F
MATAVATQAVFSHTDAIVEIWDVPAGTEKHSLIKQASSDRYGVTLTRAPGGTAIDEIELGPYAVRRPKPAGVGGDAAEAIGEFASGVALDGTWEFPSVAGATLATEQGTPVYIEADGDLTITQDTNVQVGTVNYTATYAKAAGKLPVKIGA